MATNSTDIADRPALAVVSDVLPTREVLVTFASASASVCPRTTDTNKETQTINKKEESISRPAIVMLSRVKANMDGCARMSTTATTTMPTTTTT